MRSALLLAACAACGSTQVAPATPTLNLGELGQPLPVGETIRITTAWGGRCRVPYHFPFTLFSGKLGDAHDEDCDERRFALTIDCAHHCRIAYADGSHAVDDHLRTSHGGSTYDVTPLADHERIKVTMIAGGVVASRETKETPIYVPADFKVVCRNSSDTFPCDAWPVGHDVEIAVEPVDGRRLGPVRINGRVPHSNRLVMLSPVLATAHATLPGPGDYPIEIEVNPAPYTIKRVVTVRVR